MQNIIDKINGMLEFQYELDLHCNLHSLEVFGFDIIKGEVKGINRLTRKQLKKTIIITTYKTLKKNPYFYFPGTKIALAVSFCLRNDDCL